MGYKTIQLSKDNNTKASMPSIPSLIVCMSHRRTWLSMSIKSHIE